MTDIDRRASELYREHRDLINRRTDMMFGVLMLVQLAAGIVAALVISPRAWSGSASSTHTHVWAALAIGACLSSFPLVMVTCMRGHAMTRYSIAVAQMLFSALLIHLTGGRIETHFHVFGSLAFLAFYRDWTVLVPATLVVAVDHVLRGVLWPESVFGVIAAAPWRALEHAGWVVFEDIFLTISCVAGAREIRMIAHSRAKLEHAHANTEETVRRRTAELEQRTSELKESKDRFELAVRGSRDGIWDWNLVTNRIFYAPQWKSLLGCDHEAVSDSPDEWFSRIVSGSLSAFYDAITAHIAGHNETIDLEVGMHHTSGDIRWMRCRAVAVRDGTGRATRLAGSLSDITDLRKAQDELRRAAQHDRLTDLPNREMFIDRVQRAISKARRDASYKFAVLYFDFDRFKLVNDTMGHNVGDALLRSIADRFRRFCRDTDLAARFGGDEFVVMLDGVTSQDDAKRTAMRLLAAFSDPHQLANAEIVSTASIGVVVAAADYDDAADVIRDADAAMYQAKLNGKSQVRMFDLAMHEEAERRLTMEQELRRPSTAEEFTLFYQPIVSLATGGVVGVEALVRWQHPTKGLISPGDFVMIAEDTGVIVALGNRVFRQACEQQVAWSKLLRRPIFININFSRRQLTHPTLIDMLRGTLEATGADPARIKLEITETAVMDQRHDIVPTMDAIKELGLGLAMDDFGTGYSSLSCLHRFPLDVLKIDRSFLINMGKKREFTAVIHAIITLAHHLNLEVIAEGVENEAQLAQLQGMDCRFAQGFLFSPPVRPEQVPALITKTFRRPHAA